MSHADRHDQLLDVAESLFTANGYSGVTMEDIARNAEVTRPVVYNHFGTREGAYIAVVRRARLQYDESILAEASVTTTNPRERLRRGAERFFGLLERDPDRWLLVFGSTAVLPPSHSSELAELRLGTIRAIAALLKIAAPHIDPRLLEAAAHAISGVGERLGHWRLSDPTVTTEELVEYYTEILWKGLGGHL
jgi:AcrR family transcriptional regulator